MQFRLKNTERRGLNAPWRIVSETVIGPGATSLACDEASFTQNPEMMRDGGLIQRKLCREVAHANLLACASKRPEDAQPIRVGDRLEQRNPLRDVVRNDAIGASLY